MLARLSKCRPLTPSGTPSRRKRIMGRARTAVRRSPPSPAPRSVNEREAKKKRSGNKTSGQGPMAGLRERKKARLRQQIVETALHLFRQRGYENTRIDDIVHTLEISQPTFFRYFPSKDAVLREVGRRAFARQAGRPSFQSRPPPSNACGDFTKL